MKYKLNRQAYNLIYNSDIYQDGDRDSTVNEYIITTMRLDITEFLYFSLQDMFGFTRGDYYEI